MKAIRLEAVSQLALVDIAAPEPREDEMLIRTGAATICTSDIADIRANPFGIRLPVVLGHEGAGTVVAVGAAVRGFRVGDRVAAHPVHPCGRCSTCKGGTPHLCGDMGHFGVNLPGTFAEYFVVRQDRARLLPKELDFAVAALAEPVAVCLEALAQARLQAGQRLLVVGDGPFGVTIARLASGARLGKIVIAGHHDFRLAFAGEDAVTVNTGTAPAPRTTLLQHANGDGFDAAILATASPPAVAEALGLLRPKGRLVLFSATPGMTPVDLFRVHVKELEIIGACNDQDRLDEAVAILSSRQSELKKLITHRFPISDYRQAFEAAQSSRKAAMKIAFVFPIGE